MPLIKKLRIAMGGQGNRPTTGRCERQLAAGKDMRSLANLRHHLAMAKLFDGVHVRVGLDKVTANRMVRQGVRSVARRSDASADVGAITRAAGFCCWSTFLVVVPSPASFGAYARG